jgi:hypothetical protein
LKNIFQNTFLILFLKFKIFFEDSPKSTATVSKPISPKEKINTLVSIVNNSLATLLAHTAASAHSTAALTAYAYTYYQYYNQQNPDNKMTLELAKVEPVVPIKTEIEKASDTFAKYKDKISSFFSSSKKIDEESAQKAKKQVETMPKASGLKNLLAAYGGSTNEEGECSSSDSDSDDENSKNKSSVKPEKTEVPNTVSAEPITNGKHATTTVEIVETESDTESVHEIDDDDYMLNDLNAECELEIVTTSELRADASNRNYLLPSLRASYFPLKASLELEQVNLSENVVVSEKSKFGLTLLGSGCKNSHRSLSDILYG